VPPESRLEILGIVTNYSSCRTTPPENPGFLPVRNLKPPFTHYDVQFAVALPDIDLAADSGGVRHGHFEVMLLAFDHQGNILNTVKKRSKLSMDAKVYAATEQVGMQIREEIDVPPGEVYLRTGICDLNSGKCGTVGAPLDGAGLRAAYPKMVCPVSPPKAGKNENAPQLSGAFCRAGRPRGRSGLLRPWEFRCRRPHQP